MGSSGKEARALRAAATHATRASVQEQKLRGTKIMNVILRYKMWTQRKRFEWSWCFHHYRIADSLLSIPVPECSSVSWYLLGIVHLIVVTHFPVRSPMQEHLYYIEKSKKASEREARFFFAQFFHWLQTLEYCMWNLNILFFLLPKKMFNIEESFINVYDLNEMKMFHIPVWRSHFEISMQFWCYFK